MEVTKDEQRKLDDLFRKIAERDEFVAQQRQAAETLRRKEAEPPVTVWAVVDHYTLRDWGQEGFNICGVYLTLDEAVARIHAERDKHKGEGPLMLIEGKGEYTRWDYSDWDTAHNYGIEQAPILSTFADRGNSPKSNDNSPIKDDQPAPEDSVIFQRGVAEGRRLERADLPAWQIFKGIGIFIADDYVLARFGKGYKLLRAGDTIEIGTEFLQVSQLEELPKEGQR